MIKKIFLSRGFRALVSAVLIYFAFRKANIKEIIVGLEGVPIKWIILNLIYSGIVILIGAYRWSSLLFGKVSLKKVLDFAKASFAGAFYSLLFPTGVAGDLLKWMPLQKKYPEITKFKLFGSVFLDRFIGFTAFVFVAFLSSSIGMILKYQFPHYLFWMFGVLTVLLIIFYVVVINFDLRKILNTFSKYKLIEKLHELIDMLKNNDRKVVLKCLLISFFSEFAWIMQVWFASNIFGAGFTVLSVFIFLPVIALILVLPISIAGFGAREHLYLFFFSQVVSTGDTKILLVSSFMGILGILTSLLGGLTTLF